MTDVNEQISSYSFSFLHAFFFLELSCVTSFFSFLFTPFFFFFFLLELHCFFFFSLFGVGHFSFFFWVVPNLFFLFFGLFSLFLIFWGPCVFSLSLSPSIAWTSRSEIDSSLFLAASLIVSVETWFPCRKPYHERYAQVLAPNNHMYHIRN